MGGPFESRAEYISARSPRQQTQTILYLDGNRQPSLIDLRR